MKKSLLFYLFIVILFTNCKNFSSIAQRDYSQKDAYQIACNYYDNIIYKSNLASGRSVNSFEYPEILYEIDIYDDDDNKVLFSELSEEDKYRFYEQWRNIGIDNLEKKFIDDESFKEMIALENEAFNMALDEASRSIIKKSSIKIFESYISNLDKLEKKYEYFSRSSSSEYKDVSKCTLVDTSVEIFERNYKKGRVLINTCKKKETGSGYFGHASMMSEESFNEIWKQDINSKATISSFPDNGNKKLGSSGTVWEGMKDGVQKEPIGYWCGNRCAQNVSILDVQAYKIHLFKDDYKRPATDEEYSAAVKYAEDQIGKPYLNYLIPFSMWATDSFYCSSLVFRSWYEVDQKNHLFNLRMNPIYVSPGDIYTSKSSVFVESYSNF